MLEVAFDYCALYLKLQCPRSLGNDLRTIEIGQFPRMCVVSGYRPKKGINIVSFTDLVLKDKIFIYDLARRRVGWADYDCKYH